LWIRFHVVETVPHIVAHEAGRDKEAEPWTGHEEKEVSLSHQQVAAMRQLLGSRAEVWAIGEPGRYKLKAISHVGFVRLPEGLTLVIEPKVTIETLFAPLAAVYDPSREFLREEAQAYTTVEDLFEFVTRIFASHVEDLIARGIVREVRMKAMERRGRR
jgi:hypothetical protein